MEQEQKLWKMDHKAAELLANFMSERQHALLFGSPFVKEMNKDQIIQALQILNLLKLNESLTFATHQTIEEKIVGLLKLL